MKLLLTSAGVKNASINDAMVDLLGKPIAFLRPAQSQSNSPAFTAGPSLAFSLSLSANTSGMAGSPLKGSGVASLSTCGCETPHGPGKANPELEVCVSTCPGLLESTGQYAQITRGRTPYRGGWAQGWGVHAPLRESFSSRGAEQRVLITLKGRPKGVFVLRPLEPGVLKRDSGTQHSFWTG